MTDPAVDDPAILAAVLANARYILLDFDGPVAKLFAGLSAAAIADELRQLVTSQGFQLPAELHDTSDPLAILRWAADEDDDLVRLVDKALTDAEIRAVATAEPTSGAREFLEACHATGRPVAIVSNNSSEAIHAYLGRTGAMSLVAHVEGRSHARLDQMKPDPYLLERAMIAIAANASWVAFVGDSASDVQAARAARVCVLGYANKSHKVLILRKEGADALATSMLDLASAIELSS